MREYIAAIVMIAWTAIAIYLMNMFGFQNHAHDVLWSIGAAIAIIIVILVNVYIYFVICKETPWTWFKE